MTVTATGHVSQRLTLPEELILMLLNEENGYFHQAPGWSLHCALVGAVLAELSLLSRIDTDLESLFLVDRTETGDPTLDPILTAIADAPTQKSALYWIEVLAARADSIIELTLDRLVKLNILKRHSGGFWTLASAGRRMELQGRSEGDTAVQFVRTRVSKAIFDNDLPDPRDVIIISLINACGVFRFMFHHLDEEAEERIRFICNMDLISRSIAEAVAHNIARPLVRQSALAKDIPTVPLRGLLFNPNLRNGNFPALFADLTQEYGPVFELRPPFRRPMIFLAGPELNDWVNRHGRMYLRAKEYFHDFESVYGASGVLPSLDGADHFRLRKSLAPAYSRKRLGDRADDLYLYARQFMADWTVGASYPATRLCRRMINAQLSPLFLNADSQDIIEDLMAYKERAITVHILGALPKFTLKTPGMRRRAKAVDKLIERVQIANAATRSHEHPPYLADDILRLHATDPQFLPEANLRFPLAAALVASVYLGDAFSFALYGMASQPELQSRIQEEADALFGDGDPDYKDFKISAIDVTHRLLLECLRIWPIVPMSIRHVVNPILLEGFKVPVGSRVHIAQTATHYMSDLFPDPFTFDIDRYLPPRNEHHSPGYAPYGLGVHKCLGARWMDLQLAVNVLMVAHHFTLKVSPENYKLKFNPLPSLTPSKKLKFRIAEQRREVSA